MIDTGSYMLNRRLYDHIYLFDETKEKFLYLEPSQPISARPQLQLIFGVPAPRAAATELPEVAALRANYDRDYIRGDRATRIRYARAYADYAAANPHILPVPMYGADDDDYPIKVPDARYW